MVDREKLKNVRMPRFSWDYEGCSVADHWFLMARGFQECCCHLFAEMIEEKIESRFHHAKAAVSLFEHAVELFLKAGISQADKKVPVHHRLDQLYGQFKNLYPGNDFEFTGTNADMVRPSLRAPHNEFARYPTDWSGKPWAGHSHIDLVIFFEEASKFLDDFNRLWPLMKNRYPTAN